MDKEMVLLNNEDSRVPATWQNAYEQGFIIADANGLIEVALIEVIGAGGSCLAYKAKKKTRISNTGIPSACIVKEYYPISRDDYASQIKYERKFVGEEIQIVGEEELAVNRFVKLRKYELEKQANNVAREIKISRELSYDDVDVNNSPYIYEVDDLILNKGDSSYIIIDTGEGCTLRNYLDLVDRSANNIKTDLEIIGQVLIAAERLLFSRNNGKKYCHGDLKPENIYLEGFDIEKRNVIRPKILDFGSVFLYDEYQCNIDKMSDEDIINAANYVANNEGIGCSSNGYRSAKIGKLARAKDKYIRQQHIEYAKDLIGAVNNIDISVDLYSIMQIFMELMVGKPWPTSGRISREDISGYGYSEDIVDFIETAGKKIQKNKYTTIAEVRSDINELTSLVNNEANPKVLLRQLKKEYSWVKDVEIDEKIFGNIK